jgi:hypothetical protein
MFRSLTSRSKCSTPNKMRLKLNELTLYIRLTDLLGFGRAYFALKMQKLADLKEKHFVSSV